MRARRAIDIGSTQGQSFGKFDLSTPVGWAAMNHPRLRILIASAWFVIAIGILAQKRILDPTFAAGVVFWLAICLFTGTAWRLRKR